MISQNFAGKTGNVIIQNYVTIQEDVANIPSKDDKQKLTSTFDFI